MSTFSSPPLSLRPKETLPNGIRRVIRQQIDAILKLIRHPDFSTELVHEVRKCVKKLRAILRLISREVGHGHFRHENRSLRDAGRSLSRIRDAEVLIETLNHLVIHTSLDPAPYEGLYAKLHEQRTRFYEAAREHLRLVEKTLLRLQKTMPSWELDNTQLEDLLKTISRTYRRGREAIQRYAKSPSDDRLHTVRKRTKEIWYQLRVMQELLAPSVKAVAAQSGQITDLAGLARDYGMLAAFVKAESGSKTESDLAVRLGEIQESFALAAKRQFILFYKESPSHFLLRIRPTSRLAKKRTVIDTSPPLPLLSSKSDQTPKPKKS